MKKLISVAIATWLMAVATAFAQPDQPIRKFGSSGVYLQNFTSPSCVGETTGLDAGEEGIACYDTVLKSLFWWDGTAWNENPLGTGRSDHFVDDLDVDGTSDLAGLVDIHSDTDIFAKLYVQEAAWGETPLISAKALTVEGTTGGILIRGAAGAQLYMDYGDPNGELVAGLMSYSGFASAPWWSWSADGSGVLTLGSEAGTRMTDIQSSFVEATKLTEAAVAAAGANVGRLFVNADESNMWCANDSSDAAWPIESYAYVAGVAEGIMPAKHQLTFRGTLAGPTDYFALSTVGDTTVVDLDVVALAAFLDGGGGGGGMSLDSDAEGLLLDNDEAAPGNSQVYGTDGAGVKGWYSGFISPGAVTDNTAARWNGAGGFTLQDSKVTISDAGHIYTPNDIIGDAAVLTLKGETTSTDTAKLYGPDNPTVASSLLELHSTAASGDQAGNVFSVGSLTGRITSEYDWPIIIDKGYDVGLGPDWNAPFVIINDTTTAQDCDRIQEWWEDGGTETLKSYIQNSGEHCLDSPSLNCAAYLKTSNAWTAIQNFAANSEVNNSDICTENGSNCDPAFLNDDIAGEFAAVTLKGTPVAADILLIEDNADSNNKKRITVGSLPGGGGAHDILSATHSDSLAAAVSRGSVIVGNATPKWSELVIGGASSVFFSDGTDAFWDTTPSINCSDCTGIPAAADLNDITNVTLTTPSDGGVLCFTGTSNNSVDCTPGGDISATEDTGTLTVAVNNTKCSGGTTYLDGDGNCDDISGVYEPAGTYSGVGTCTNQFARTLNDGAAPTCEGVVAADIAADTVGTGILDDGTDTPLAGEWVQVDAADTSQFSYRTDAELLSDTGAITSSGVTYENLDGNSDVGFGAAQVPQGSLTAPLASPALTGDPTCPTAAADDNDTSIASTAFVQQEHDDSAGTCTNQFVRAVNADAAPTCATVAAADVAADVATQAEIDLKANLASPTFTGNPLAPTATQGDSDTSIATTDFVDRRWQKDCKTIEDLVAADDEMFVDIALVNITIEAVSCNADAAATVVFQDYGNNTIETVVCETDGAVAWDTTISGTATLIQGEVMELDTTSASSPTWTVFCYAWSND